MAKSTDEQEENVQTMTTLLVTDSLESTARLPLALRWYLNPTVIRSVACAWMV